MGENLFIVFTQARHAPEKVESFLKEDNRLANNDIIGVTFGNIHYGIDNPENQPGILIISDSYTFEGDAKENLKKMICKYRKIYVIYHEGSDATGKQQNVIRNVCKTCQKLLYEATEHHTEGNFAADALTTVITALPGNQTSGNEDLYKQGLDELLNNPDYCNPYLESFIHLIKFLRLLLLRIKTCSLKTDEVNAEIEKIKEKEEMELAAEQFLKDEKQFNFKVLQDKATAIEEEIINLTLSNT
jgi:hypothetical protein